MYNATAAKRIFNECGSDCVFWNTAAIIENVGLRPREWILKGCRKLGKRNMWK